jgi:hypothetical protein
MKACAFVFFIPFFLLQSAENNGRGTKAVAMGNAFVAVCDNPWAASYNAAGLAQIQHPYVSAFYVPQQFGLPELKTTALAVAHPINPGTVGISLEQFGFQLYRLTTISVGYGANINRAISIGVTANLEHTSIDRYGTSYDATVDIGLHGRLFEGLAMGFSMKNVGGTTIGKTHDRLPQSLFFGIAYSPIKEFLIVSELEKDAQFPLVLKVGIEQRFLEFLSVRCGAANNPDKFSAGFAIRYSLFEFGYAGYSHIDLGWTHQIDLSIRWADD